MKLRWFGENPNSLRNALKDYPAYEVPHARMGIELTLSEAEDNLKYLLAVRPLRLKYLADLLRIQDVDLYGGLRAPRPDQLVSDFDRWARASWSTVSSRTLEDKRRWLTSRRRGNDIAYSLVTDVSIALAELVILHRPDFGWAIDHSKYNLEMYSYNRPILLRPQVTSDPLSAIEYDIEAYVYSVLTSAWRPTAFALPFGRPVLRLIYGEYDRHS